MLSSVSWNILITSIKIVISINMHHQMTVAEKNCKLMTIRRAMAKCAEQRQKATEREKGESVIQL